ncbi:MAG: beta-propeller fold lactonase family protein [Ignavibacteria bacterium]|nr:beta-propeller fold lactonase family protein [Ignavibacteria bacterium]
MSQFISRLKSLIYTFLSLSLVCSIIVVFQSCEQDFIAPTNGTLYSEVQKIFKTPYTSSNITCSTPSCHASENSAAGLDLTNWQNILNGSNSGTMVIPYNGFWSHMVSFLNSDTNLAPVTLDSLFPQYHKINQNDVVTIFDWINDGAKNEIGQVAFSNVPINEKGFITNQAADLVAVIKPDTRQVIRLIPVGGIGSALNSPHYIKLSPDNNYFYVSLIGAGYVQKFDANTHSQIGVNMQAGQSPAHIEISSDGLSGYVTNFESSGSVKTTRKFNTSTMTITDVFSEPRMTGPHGMALTNDGNTLYVTSEIGEYIFKINTNSFYASDTTYIKASIDPSVPPSGNGTGNFRPYQILLSPDESLLFVSCRGSNEVRVYNSSDLTQVNSIPLGSNAFPLLMKFTNDGNYLFVCNRNNNTVSVINTASQTVQTTITGVGIQPHGVDFTADGQYAFIACETQSGFDGHHPSVGSKKIGVTRVIQVSNFSLLPNTKLEMGSFPAGIEFVK